MITIFIIVGTIIFSVIAFPRGVQTIESIRKPEWFDKFKFNAYMVIQKKEWHRLFTSGLLHANWMHLAFNMFVLWSFGKYIEDAFTGIVYEGFVGPYNFAGFGKIGMLVYLLFYIVAIAVSSLYDLIKHKNNHAYNAIGASGAVSAILFTSILFYPTHGIGILFIPISIPAFILGPLYLLYSYVMSKKNIDNIGHNAHFYGALFGFIVPIIVRPAFFLEFIAEIMDFVGKYIG